MSINQTLTREVLYDDYYEYSCDATRMREFLNFTGDFLARQKEAVRLIGEVMAANRKQELLGQVAEELAEIEHLVRELQPWARDHVVHALLSFILGIYINSNFLRPNVDISAHPLQWKLAGMFHDVGYPVQIARDALLQRFTTRINHIRQRFGVQRPEVYPRAEIVNLDRLQNDVSSFDLIQERLNEWGLKINARQENERMVESGVVYHGIVSSLAVLYLLDVLYEKYNPERKHEPTYAPYGDPGYGVDFNQTHFEMDIVSACSAIFVHDLPEMHLQTKIDRTKAPLAFLLKLSDTLQEWERPSLRNPVGFPASRFDIKVEKAKLVFHADVPPDRKAKMKSEITSSLIAPDIEIL